MQDRRGSRGEVAALVSGLLLRALFVTLHPRFVGDTLVYGDLAHNMLAHHVYGLTEGAQIRSTLIRLPGYPLFLAACFVLFGTANYLAVVWVQVVVDLFGCWLLARLARRMFGQQAGRLCLWSSALCPFTANYAAAALTETLSIFCVIVAFWTFAEWTQAVRDGTRGLFWVLVLGGSLSEAVLLRPDGILLAGAVLPAMAWVTWRSRRDQSASSLRPAHHQAAPWRDILVTAGLLAGCLALWTARNWRLDHVLQPLAPKYANDPGEPAPLGFARWYRTWAVGLGDTARVYWVYDGDLLPFKDLPARAFDSPAQKAATATLIAQYNAETSSTPAFEAAFERLAAERVRAHPVRYYVLLPLARLGDMWFRPRTELLPRMPLDWWRLGSRPKAALFGWFYGLLNLALLACALAGGLRWGRVGGRGSGALVAAMGGFVLLRSVLLMTIDNSEPRYVLECYPVVLLFASLFVSGFWGRTRPPQP